MAPYNHNIPSMTTAKCQAFIRDLGRNWTGKGRAVELGSWLGATAYPLLEGLIQAKYDKTFWAFDQWQANKQQVKEAGASHLTRKPVELVEGQDLRPLFLRNVNSLYPKVIAIKGGLPESLVQYDPHPIEILIFDAPKKEPVFSGAIKGLYKYWQRGMILGLLDYHFYLSPRCGNPKANEAPVNFINNNKECFTEITPPEWDESESAKFFRFDKPLKIF